jgi:hypothetical protein
MSPVDTGLNRIEVGPSIPPPAGVPGRAETAEEASFEELLEEEEAVGVEPAADVSLASAEATIPASIELVPPAIDRAPADAEPIEIAAAPRAVPPIGSPAPPGEPIEREPVRPEGSAQETPTGPVPDALTTIEPESLDPSEGSARAEPLAKIQSIEGAVPREVRAPAYDEPIRLRDLTADRAELVLFEGDEQISLTVSTDGDRVRVSATAPSIQMVDALARSSGDLRDALGRRGYQLDRFEAKRDRGGGKHETDPPERRRVIAKRKRIVI